MGNPNVAGFRLRVSSQAEHLRAHAREAESGNNSIFGDKIDNFD